MKKKLGIILFMICVGSISIANLSFDVTEWDESQYILASEANYQNHSYFTYNRVDTQKNVEQKRFPYPNILYTYTFGAFTSFFHLPANHESRFIFTLVLSILLLIIIGLLYNLIVDKHISNSLYFILLLFTILLVFYPLWKVRNTQIGATILLGISLYFLLLSYIKPHKGIVFELLSILFLFLSYYWKEQILPLLILFPWFMNSDIIQIKKKYRAMIYYSLLTVTISLLVIVLYYFSINAGATNIEYFYSAEQSHWANGFSLLAWLNKLIKIPLTYIISLLLFYFIKNKDYQQINLLKNKLFITGFIYFCILSILYFYQGTSYIGAINYATSLLILPYGLALIQSFYKQYKFYSLLGFFFIPLILFYYSVDSKYSIFKHFVNSSLPEINFTEITPSDIIATNKYSLIGSHLPARLRKNPILEFTDIDTQHNDMDIPEIIDSLEKLHPKIVIFYPYFSTLDSPYPQDQFFYTEVIPKGLLQTPSYTYVLTDSIDKALLVLYRKDIVK